MGCGCLTGHLEQPQLRVQPLPQQVELCKLWSLGRQSYNTAHVIGIISVFLKHPPRIKCKLFFWPLLCDKTLNCHIIETVRAFDLIPTLKKLGLSISYHLGVFFVEDYKHSKIDGTTHSKIVIGQPHKVSKAQPLGPDCEESCFIKPKNSDVTLVTGYQTI